MEQLTPGEATMIAALARQVKDGDWAACGTLSPMPAAAVRRVGGGGLARGRFVQGGKLRVNLGDRS